MTNHFIGVTAAPEKAQAFGCGRTFAFRDWVGGRYSLWSAIGLPIAITFGMDAFNELLRGAYDMDQHFKTMPWQNNIPVLWMEKLRLRG